MESAGCTLNSSVEEEESEGCPICYEAYEQEQEGAGEDDEETGNTTFQKARPKERLIVQGCQHEFCRACLTAYCQHAVSVRDIPIRCPASASDLCDNTLGDGQIQDLLCSIDVTTNYGSIINHTNSCSYGDNISRSVSHSDWAKFQRFQKLHQDPSLIPCLRCEELLSEREDRPFGSENDGRDHHQLVCPSCHHQFCAVHGDAHLGTSCAEYKPDRQLRQSEKVIRRFTKPCSHCGIPIQKESGCDHIVCSSCKQDMCFRCGTHTHLTGEMVRNCRQCEQHFVDHRYIWRYRLTLCLYLPFYLPICILHILVMGTMAVVSCGCFCCLGCGVQLEKDETTFAPLEGIRNVLAMVFLPALTFARQCGIPCCCSLDFLGMEQNEPPSPTTVLNSNNSDDDDGESSVNEV